MRTMIKFGLFGLVAGLAGPLAAQTLEVSSGATVEHYFQPANRTDLSAYVEAARNGAFGGLSLLASSDDTRNEVNLYLGYEGEGAAGLSYEVGYYHYMYPNDRASDYGELALSLGKDMTDSFSGSFDLAYDPQAGLANAYVGADYAIADALELSANFGVYQVDGASGESEWDLGLSYSLSNVIEADLRFYDGTDYEDGYFGLVLSWDTTLLSR